MALDKYLVQARPFVHALHCQIVIIMLFLSWMHILNLFSLKDQWHKNIMQCVVILAGAAQVVQPVRFWPVTRKPDPPFLVPPAQIYRNIWTPRIIYFNFAEIFGPPEQKFLKYLDLLEIFYPPSFYQPIA